jgi:integrase
MASITKRARNKNSPWVVRWYAEDGKQREAAFRLRSEANDFRIKVEHDTRTGNFIDPKLGAESFIVAAERYIGQLAAAPETKRAYRSVLTNHVKPALGGRTLRQVGADRDGITRLLNVALVGLSDSRREIARAVVVGTLDEAVRGGKLPQHRASGIRLTSNGRAPDRSDFVFPSKAQLDKLAAGLQPPRVITKGLPLSIRLMRGCGLRVSEALAVRDTCLSGDVLRISEQIAPDGRSTVPLKHRKAGEYREIPAPGYVREAIAGHVDEYGIRDGYLFAGVRVPYVMHRSYLKAFSKAVEDAGIPAGFVPHSLRHVFASSLLSAGVPITDVAEWLGHRSIQVTYGIYGHLVPSALGRAAEALDAEYAAWSDEAA